MLANNLHSRNSKRKTIILSLSFILVTFCTYQVASYLSQDGVIAFYKGILRNPTTVGALVPCSEYVANETVRYLNRSKQDFVNVLEVGGGTGQFTKSIVNSLEKLSSDGAIKKYNVDVVEIDNQYCQELERMFAKYPNVNILCQDACNINDIKKYDFIISSLPFTNIPPDVVNKILENYKNSIKDGGVVSYIKHRFLPKGMSFFLFGSKYAEFKKREEFVRTFRRSGKSYKRNTVWRNIIPMFVYHVKF